MDEVAAAAHMSKATLYRLWQGKAGLVSAALQQFTCVAEPADTGSLRGDLIATALRMPAASEERATLLSALVHVARGEPTLRQLLRDRLVRPNEEAISEIFSRAVRRGELSGDSPLLAEIPHLVIYAVLGRVLIDGLVPDEAYALAMIDRIVLPLLDAAGAAHAGATHPPHDRLEP
jgi:AcrR family transcriptional regulator